MSKRAIFLGSFNPPHKGHYDVIKNVIDSGIMNELNIKKIHIIPCWQNPNKSKQTPFIHRYRMCTNIFSDLVSNNDVVVDPIEEEIQPNYTYELIEHFNSGNDEYINKNKEGFWWIITVETIKELMQQKWKNSNELLYNNNFIIVGKYEEEWNQLLTWYSCNKIICAKFIKLNSTHNCHSTDIRNNFWVNAKYDDCLTTEVKNYIIENNLYNE